MVQIFREVWRVMRQDATLWLNFGDSYTSGNRTHRRDPDSKNVPALQNFDRIPTPPGLKPKDLCGMPWRLAFALQADGWYLRSDIIWHKPNPMPESCTDRPTKSHEYLFLLTKSAQYYYDCETIKEKATMTGGGLKHNGPKHNQGGKAADNSNFGEYKPNSRNKRTVWTIPTEPTPEAHFATFPKKLVEPCILAGTSEKGCCAECGAPWIRVVEKGELKDDPGRMNRNVKAVQFSTGENDYVEGGTLGKVRESKTIGWKQNCSCRVYKLKAGLSKMKIAMIKKKMEEM
jgi:hypothetical protein